MEQKIKDWDHCGTLRIGASITIGTHILPLMLKQYQEIYPMLKITVIIKQSAAIEQLVLENKIDIALIENQPEYADIMAIPFMTDHLCAIVPVTHPLADKKWVTLEEVSAYPFLMREKGSAGREILDAGFELKNITVHPVWESTSTQAIEKSGVCRSWRCRTSLPFSKKRYGRESCMSVTIQKTAKKKSECDLL